MNSRVKGNIGIGQAIAYYTSLGHTVSIPLTDTQPYDLIVDDGGNGKFLFRIQVKYTASMRDGKYKVPLRTIRCNTKGIKVTKLNPDCLDILFVVASNGDRWEIPIVKMEARSELTMGDKYKQWKVGNGCSTAF